MKCCTIKYVIIIVVCYSLSRSHLPVCSFFRSRPSSFSKKKRKKRTVCVLISIPIRAALTYVSSRETNAHRSVLNEVKGSIRSLFFLSVSLCVCLCLCLCLCLSLFPKLNWNLKRRARDFFPTLFFPCPDLFKFRGCSSSFSRRNYVTFLSRDSRDGKNNVRSRTRRDVIDALL